MTTMTACQVCGGPVRSDNTYGVCIRTLACRAKRQLIYTRNLGFDERNARKRKLHEANYVVYALHAAKQRAKAKGVPFSLTSKNTPPIPDVCPALGIPLKPNKGYSGPDSPSLDRITPELGYVPGNVQWLSHRANTIKQNATADELFAVWAFLAGGK